MRVAVYTDSVYREADGVLHGEIAFNLFLAALGAETDLTVIGRLDPSPGAAHYPLPAGVTFVGLPYYESLSRPLGALRSLIRALVLFWRALDQVDCVWLFGPYLHSLLFALVAIVRRRAVVLGVRQDFPAYVRGRRPTTRWMHVAADLLEASWRALARRCPVVVVGPELAANYRKARALLQIAVSLITAEDVAAGRRADRSFEGELTVLSVGRLEEEKNPLLLADVLAELRRRENSWRISICGEGPLEQPLREKLRELGILDAAVFHGHVPLHGGLLDLYREAHAFLHVSWTEGFPQVLIEAFASGTPTVATAVGGVPAAAGGAALLVPADDATAAAASLARLVSDGDLRRQLQTAGFAIARERTLEREISRVLGFLKASLR